MNKIINEQNLDKIRNKNSGNLQNSIKQTILNFLECNYEEILDSNKFTEQNLEDISQSISDDEELNNFIDDLVAEALEKFKTVYNIS